MNWYFLDSSALVMHYSLESGTREVRRIVEWAVAVPPVTRVVICDFAWAETRSALRQKRDEKKMSRAEWQYADDRVRKDQTHCPFLVVGSSGVMEHASDLSAYRTLRGGDSVHVAAALAARSSVPFGCSLSFVTTDKEQAAAARIEGFDVYDPVELRHLKAA